MNNRLDKLSRWIATSTDWLQSKKPVKRLLILGIVVLGIIPLSLQAAISIVGTPTVSDITDNSATISVTTTGSIQANPTDPTIHSFNPNIIPAGKASGPGDTYRKLGVINFSDASIPFTVTGTNLTGATISVTNPGISFAVTNVSSDGKTITGNITSKANSRDGAITITVKNGAGKTVTQVGAVTITGTQYLKRTYRDKVWFLGDWNVEMPNENVSNLKRQIDNGLASIQGSSYKKLGILPVVYSDADFYLSGCPADSGGCASRDNNIIRVKDFFHRDVEGSVDMSDFILHESAHKLDYYNRGEYTGVPGMLTSASGFFTEWKKVVGNVSPATCKYLPLESRAKWKDQTDFIPRCGFIWAYGASDLGVFYEDIATMTADSVYHSDLLQKGDAPTDLRYKNKTGILKKYGFI